MSRTYKDRPHWVRSKDPRESRIFEHWHYDLGKEVIRYKPILDEAGNAMYETITRKFRAFRDGQFIDAEELIEVVACERIIIGVRPDTCCPEPHSDSDYSKNNKDRWNRDPDNYTCHYQLKLTCGYRPSKRQKNLYQRGHRKNENNKIREFVKLENSLYDDENFNYEIDTRLHRHNGWWD